MKIRQFFASTLALAVVAAFTSLASAQPAPVPPKAATAATKAANAAVLKALPFGDKEDFANASAASSTSPTR